MRRIVKVPVFGLLWLTFAIAQMAIAAAANCDMAHTARAMDRFNPAMVEVLAKP